MLRLRNRPAFTLVELPVVSAGKRKAFTLVELLVVIGIIAVLIGVLLPVLSKVQGRARDLKCQSNLRQMTIALLGYAAENKGSLPYGLVFLRHDPVTWDPDTAADPDELFACWCSSIGKYMGKGRADDNSNENFPPVLLCPEAELAVGTHVVSYAGSLSALARPDVDASIAGYINPYPYPKPALLTQLRPKNILLYDTAVHPNAENSVLWLVGLDVDQERLWKGAKSPQYRWYDPSDKYGRLGTGSAGNNKPIAYYENPFFAVAPKPQTGFSDPPQNYPVGSRFYLYWQGILRFRHAKNTMCNVSWADGHVEPLIPKEVLRHFFMPKWPPGVRRDSSVP